MDGSLISQPINPTIGIGAGSAFATYELVAYVLADMRCIQTNHPQAAISLHVDDLTPQITGQGVQNTVDNTMAMADEVIETFENNLGLPFDPQKSTTHQHIQGSSHHSTTALRQTCRQYNKHHYQTRHRNCHRR